MCRRLGLLAVALLLCSFSAQSATITAYYDPAAFNAAAMSLLAINFEGLAPNNSFQNYANPAGLTTDQVNFAAAGTGPFGVGNVTVLGAGYAATQSAVYDTGTGAILIYTPSNQPGTAYLDITLPSGITAVGTDFWAVQPYITTMQVTVQADDMSSTFPVSTVTRPTSTFFGVTSDAPISSLQFHFPAGQVGVILDNFRLGQAEVVTPPEDAVPEPGAAVLVGAALLAIGLLRRFRHA
jgi:hypothetical protein